MEMTLFMVHKMMIIYREVLVTIILMVGMEEIFSKVVLEKTLLQEEQNQILLMEVLVMIL